MMRSPSPRCHAFVLLVASLGATARPLAGQEAACAVVRGDDYEARFDSDSWDLVPDRSDAAPRRAWRYRLLAVGRGSAGGSARLSSPSRSTEGGRVSYARPGFVERYDVRRDGIEQSFVFDTLPPGSGDLVVRGRVTTELVVDVAGAPAGQLHFGDGRGRGVRVGEVTGIDARGRTAPGVLRLAGDVLELVLPARFVDAAALPLVLDPLIGPIVSPSTAVAADTAPDVAYDETNDVFLVVFGRDDPALPLKVLGLLLRPDGTVVGAPFEIGDGEQPKVGNVNARDAFVVAYQRADGAFARRVSAATGEVSAELLLAGSYVRRVLDVGDSSSATNDQVPLLYFVANFFPGISVGVRVRVPNTGPPRIGESFFSPFFYDANIYIARLLEISALPGHYLCAFDEWSHCSLTPRHVWLALVDPTGASTQTIAVTPSYGGGSTPALAGAGEDFIVAYEHPGAGVVCHEVSVASGSIVLGSQTVVEPATVSRARWECKLCPSATRLDGSYLVGFERLRRAVAVSLDPAACTPCEGELTLGGGTGTSLAPVIAARTPGGRPADEAVLAWARSATRQSIEASAFRADDGVVTDLGGGCAPGGRALASCARAGNPSFEQELRGAAASAPALLLLGLGRSSFACGPCTVVPDLATAVVAFSGSTDPRGCAATTMPLPAVPGLVGVALVEQWVVVAGGACPLFGIALSNGIEVVIQ